MSLSARGPTRPAGEAESYAALEARVARADMSRCCGCHACAQRCIDGIELSHPEFSRLMAAAGALQPGELARVLSQPKAIAGWDETGVRLCPLLDRETDCCLIYAARPLICRLMGLAPWLPCPSGECEPFEDALDIMLAYAELERHTLEEWSLRTGAHLGGPPDDIPPSS